jgi:hypothetical protein
MFMVWNRLSPAAEPFPGGVTIDPGSTNGFVPEACPQHYVSHETGMLACPSMSGLTILPAHYPPRTLFVGYSPEPSYLTFLRTLIERNAHRSRPLQIIVLVPRLDTEQAYQDLKSYMHRPQANHLTFFTAPSDETLWMQDYMEIGLSLKDGHLKMIDLPYTDREGEALPAAIALSCQFDLIPQPSDSTEDEQDNLPQHGNYGGNIEALPGNLLLIGNTMGQATQKHLRHVFRDMPVISIDVRWLDTGHVDELFSVLPDRSDKAACPFAIGYTSPKLALELVHQYGFNSRKQILPPPVSLEDVSLELQDASFFTECLSLYAHDNIQTKRCRRFIQANMAYEALIQRERSRIDAALVKHTACAHINWIALPQLFVPSYGVWLQEGTWGSDADQAQALNPNAANMIALGEEVFIPEQPYQPFAQEISWRLEKLGLSLVRVDSALSHYLSGGLHCNTAVARMCGARR